MTRKSMIILGAVIVLVVAGVFTVAAQSDTATPTCPGTTQAGQGMMGMGNGMMQGNRGFMMGGMMDDDEDTMMAAAAKVLGLEQTAFVEKLHSGQTLAEIAKVQGVEVQAVYDAMLAQAKEHMAARVTAGTMTQAQADAHLTWMRDNIATMPMFAGSAGNCMGNMGSNGNAGHGMGMMGHGMMGGMMQHGHGMMGNNS